MNNAKSVKPPDPIDYFIESFPYLEAKQIAGPYNVIRLADAIRSAGYIKTVEARNFKYFKLSSVAYPVMDANRLIFLESDKYYQVPPGNKVNLFFPPIQAGVLVQADCIYTDSCDTLTSAPDTFNMIITFSNTLISELGNYNQTLELRGTRALDGAEAVWLFQNLKTFSIRFRSGVAATVPYVTDQKFYYDKANKRFSTSASGSVLLVNSDLAITNKSLEITRDMGVFTGPAYYTGALSGGLITVNSYQAQFLNAQYLGGFSNTTVFIKD